MLSEQLTADLKTAMLNREADKVSVLRMLQSELKNAAISKMHELSELEQIEVIRKEIKKRGDAAAQYEIAGNMERSNLEKSEAALLQTYLPAAVDDSTLMAFLEKESEKLGTLEARHKGDLIRAAMAEFTGRINGQQASRLVGELFAKHGA